MFYFRMFRGDEIMDRRKAKKEGKLLVLNYILFLIKQGHTTQSLQKICEAMIKELRE